MHRPDQLEQLAFETYQQLLNEAHVQRQLLAASEDSPAFVVVRARLHNWSKWLSTLLHLRTA